jgi:hypothetical protein
MVFKLPPFKPNIKELRLLEEPNLGIIESMALFGKVSAHGVGVSVTSNELNNTGIKYPLGSILQVNNLLQNESYCFAAAAYNADNKVSNDIGLTGETYVALNPMPINQLYAYLAKVAYQIGDHKTA